MRFLRCSRLGIPKTYYLVVRVLNLVCVPHSRPKVVTILTAISLVVHSSRGSYVRATHVPR